MTAREDRPYAPRGYAALCAALTVLAPAAASAVPITTTTETVLYAFQGGGDGVGPVGGLIADTQGNLYGTTLEGGGSGCGGSGCGTVFKLDWGDWTPHQLYAFQGGSDGAKPNAGLIFDSKVISMGRPSRAARRSAAAAARCSS